MNLNLSLSIQGGLHCVMPLLSEETDENQMAALLVSLQRSDVEVRIKKELACYAKFEGFKVSFVNFDENVSVFHCARTIWLADCRSITRVFRR